VAVHDLAQQAPADLISLPPPLHTRPRTRRPWSASTSSRSRSSLPLDFVARALTRRCARQMLPELKDLVARGLFTRVRLRARAYMQAADDVGAHVARDAGDREEADGARERARPARAAHGRLPGVRRVRGPARGAPPQARRPPPCALPLILSQYHQGLMRRSEARAAERRRLRARAPAVRGVRARAQEVRRGGSALGRVHPQGAGRGGTRARRAPLRTVRPPPPARAWDGADG
jgi:hypothetical protein